MAIADPGRQYDGFSALPLGMDSSFEPNLIDKKNYALGVNLVCRGGKIKSRPGFVQMDLEADPEDPDALTAFESGTYQGGCIFTEPSSRDDVANSFTGSTGKTYIIIVASGWIFRIDPRTKKIIRLNGTQGTTMAEQAILSVSGSGTLVTVTTDKEHGLRVGDKVTVSGCTPNTLNSSGTAVLVSVPSLNSFVYSVATNFANVTNATVVGTYLISQISKGYLSLPKFMDTTYYGLTVSGAYPVSTGSGITNNSKVLIEDPQPTRLSLGVTGTGFLAQVVSSSGTASYVTIANGGEGFSDSAIARVAGSTDAQLTLRFKRDSSQANRPWPDRSHQTSRHTFCQAEKFLIIQDGISAPFIFDGTYLRRSYINGHPALSFGTGSGKLVGVVVTHRGSGYTVAPTIAFTGGGGSNAAATANLNSTNGQLETITITNAGSGYTSIPTVTITPGAGDTTGSGAKAYAILAYPKEVPVGSIMSYGQGRLFVSSSNRFEIKSLDFVGSHVNKTAGVDIQDNVVYPLKDPRASILFNTEELYLSGGGSFLMPSYMGKITGLKFLPTKDVAAGQGDLYAFCEFGAASFQVGQQRSSWGTTGKFQSLLFDKIGAVGPEAFAGVNGDLFFRSNDGIRTYRNASASNEDPGNTALSAEIADLLKIEALPLLGNVSMVYTDDSRLLVTAQPKENQPANADAKGTLVYKAIVSCDLQPLNRSASRGTMVYDGIWTGLDFLQLFNGQFDRKNKTFVSALSCNKLTFWSIQDDAIEDRPVPGFETTYKTSLFNRSHVSSYIRVGLPDEVNLRIANSASKFLTLTKTSGAPFTQGNFWKVSAFPTTTTRVDTYIVPPGVTFANPGSLSQYDDPNTSTWRICSYESLFNSFYAGRVNPSTSVSEIPVLAWSQPDGLGVSNTYFNDNNVFELSLGSFGVDLNSQFKLEFEFTNSAVNWTNLSPNQTAVGAEISLYYSPDPLGQNSIFKTNDYSSVSRQKTIYYKPYAGNITKDSVFLGNLQKTGFLYIYVRSVGTLPGNNTVNLSGSLKAVSTGATPITSELHTRSYSFDSIFELKKLVRSDLWLSGLQDNLEASFYYRPDQSPNWVLWDQLSLNRQTDNKVELLPFETISRTGVNSSSTISYVTDLLKYQSDGLDGLGVSFLLTTGATGPGGNPIVVNYQTSSLTPAAKNALAVGTQAYSDFISRMSSFSVPLPTSLKEKKYVNLLNTGERYLYMDISYPVVTAGSSYNLTVDLYRLSQKDSTPNQVVSSGFFTALKNFAPQYATQIRLPTPAEVENPVTKGFFSTGHEFQLRLVWRGKMVLQKLFLHARALVENIMGNNR